MIKDNWNHALLSEICEINPGRKELQNVKADTEVSFLPMAAVSEDGKIIAPETRKLKEVIKGFTYFRDGDVLVAKITPCFENGKRAIAKDLINGLGFGSTEFHVLRPKDGVSSDWIFYAISKDDFRNIAKSQMTGTAGQKRVPRRVLDEYKIPVPDKNEQNAITEIIETQFTRLDAAIRSLNIIKDKLGVYRRSVLKVAFDGNCTDKWRKLNSSKLMKAKELVSKIEEFNKIKQGKDRPGKLPDLKSGTLRNLPEGWFWIEAHKICTSVRDGTHDTPSYVEEGIPLITSKNLSPRGIDLSKIKYISRIDHEEIKKRSDAEEKDILFAMIGTIGNPTLVDMDFEFSIKNVGLFKKNEELLYPEYLKYWLESSVCLNLLKKLDLIKGTTQQFIPLGHLRILPVPYCDITEQKQVIEEIESRFSVINKLEEVIGNSLKKAESLRRSILKAAFEGKLIN